MFISVVATAWKINFQLQLLGGGEHKSNYNQHVVACTALHRTNKDVVVPEESLCGKRRHLIKWEDVWTR